MANGNVTTGINRDEREDKRRQRQNPLTQQTTQTQSQPQTQPQQRQPQQRQTQDTSATPTLDALDQAKQAEEQQQPSALEALEQAKQQEQQSQPSALEALERAKREDEQSFSALEALEKEKQKEESFSALEALEQAKKQDEGIPDTTTVDGKEVDISPIDEDKAQQIEKEVSELPIHEQYGYDRPEDMPDELRQQAQQRQQGDEKGWMSWLASPFTTAVESGGPTFRGMMAAQAPDKPKQPDADEDIPEVQAPVDPEDLSTLQRRMGRAQQEGLSWREAADRHIQELGADDLSSAEKQSIYGVWRRRYGQDLTLEEQGEQAVVREFTEAGGEALNQYAGVPGVRPVVTGALQSAIETGALTHRALETTGLTEPGTADSAQRTSQLMSQIRESAQQQASEEGGVTLPESASNMVEGATRSLVDIWTLKNLGGPSRAGQTAAVLGGYGAKSADRAITRGKDAGLRGGDLAAYASGQGALEAGITGAFALAGLHGLERFKGPMKAGVKNALKEMGYRTLSEVPEELAVEWGQALHDTTYDLRDNPNLSPEEIQQIVGTTLMTVGAAEGIQRASRQVDSGQSADEQLDQLDQQSDQLEQQLQEQPDGTQTGEPEAVAEPEVQAADEVGPEVGPTAGQPTQQDEPAQTEAIGGIPGPDQLAEMETAQVRQLAGDIGLTGVEDESRSGLVRRMRDLRNQLAEAGETPQRVYAEGRQVSSDDTSRTEQRRQADDRETAPPTEGREAAQREVQVGSGEASSVRQLYPDIDERVQRLERQVQRSTGNQRSRVQLAETVSSDEAALAQTAKQRLGTDIAFVEGGGTASRPAATDPDPTSRLIYLRAGEPVENTKRLFHHEWVHDLAQQDPDSYQELAQFLKDNSPTLLEQARNRYMREVGEHERVRTEEEAVAELGQELSPDFGREAISQQQLERIARQRPNLFQRIGAALKRTLRRFGLAGDQPTRGEEIQLQREQSNALLEFRSILERAEQRTQQERRRRAQPQQAPRTDDESGLQEPQVPQEGRDQEEGQVTTGDSPQLEAGGEFPTSQPQSATNLVTRQPEETEYEVQTDRTLDTEPFNKAATKRNLQRAFGSPEGQGVTQRYNKAEHWAEAAESIGTDQQRLMADIALMDQAGFLPSPEQGRLQSVRVGDLQIGDRLDMGNSTVEVVDKPGDQVELERTANEDIQFAKTPTSRHREPRQPIQTAEEVGTEKSYRVPADTTIPADPQSLREVRYPVEDMGEEPPFARQRDVSPLGFYSPTGRAIRQSKIPANLKSSQMQAAIKKLPGVKDEEIAWSGLDEFLEGRDRVTKQEVLDFLDQNQVQVEEVVRTGRQLYESQREEIYREFRDRNITQQEVNERLRDLDARTAETKYEDYQLPGGENYRELLLTLPQTRRESARRVIDAASRSYEEGQRAQEQEGMTYAEATQAIDERGYQSPHWDEPNVLAHVRANDRVDEEGNRLLFIDEIQSDWHQEGRRKGYQDDPVREEYDRLIRRQDELLRAGDEEGDLTTEQDRELGQINERIDQISDRFAQEGLRPDEAPVPAAPFKKNWHELALKRMVRLASEQDYDGIAWTTGEQQARRYDQDAQDRTQGMSGFYDNMLVTAANKIGKKQGVKADQTRIATNVMDYPSHVEQQPDGSYAIIMESGEPVGSHNTRDSAQEGLEELARNAREEVHRLTITDKMREAIPDEGLPLFARRRDTDQLSLAGEAEGRTTTGETPQMFDQPTEAAQTPREGQQVEPPALPENSEQFGLSQQDIANASLFSEGQPSAPFAYGVKRWQAGHDGVARVEGMTADQAREAKRGFRAAEQGAPEAQREARQQERQKDIDGETAMLFARRNGAPEDIDQDQAITFARWRDSLNPQNVVGMLAPHEGTREAVGSFMSSLRRNFTSKGNLTQDTFDQKIARDSKIKSRVRMAEYALADFNRAARRTFGGRRNMSPWDIHQMDLALKGQIEIEQLPEGVQEPLAQMRNQIDQLSHEMIDTGAVEGELALTVKENMGVYAHRSYRVFDDPKWAKNVPEDVRNKAKAFLRKQYEDTIAREWAQQQTPATPQPGDVQPQEGGAYGTEEQAVSAGRRRRDVTDPDNMIAVQMEDGGYVLREFDMNQVRAQIRNPDTDANQYFEDRIQGIIDNLLYAGKAADSPISFITQSKLGAKDLSILKQRKGIPPEIRALWGEYRDPRVNYAKSVSKMTHLTANHQFLEQIKQTGLGNWLHERPIVRDGVSYNRQIAADESSVLYPLNGLYTSAEIDQAFRDAVETTQPGSFMQVYRAVNATVKLGKTVGSLMTHVRNTVSILGFSVANGHWRVDKLGTSAGQIATDLAKLNNKKLRERYQYLTELGVLHEGARAGEMEDFIKDIGRDDTIVDVAEKKSKSLPGQVAQTTKLSAKKLVGASTRLYQAEDDFRKIYAFENERARYRNALPDRSDEEIDQMAAEVVRNTDPTYSLVPRAGKAVRKFPLVGTFVSFPAEVVRTTGHRLAITQRELADPQLRRIGAERLVGQLLAATMTGALADWSMWAMGLTDDDDENARQFVPPWSQNSELVYIGRNEDGQLRYIDMSYTDPHEYIKKPVMAFMRGDNWQDSVIEAGWEAAEPFLGAEILAQHITEAFSNKTQTGGQVYNPASGWDDISGDILNHLSGAIEPGTVRNARRIYKGISGDVSNYGEGYDPEIEAMAVFTGHRIQTLDIPQALQFNAGDYVNQKRNATRILTDIARNRGEVSDDEIREAYQEMERSRKHYFENMHRSAQAALKLGEMSEHEVFNILDSAGLSKEDANQVLSGVYRPYEPSNRFLSRTIEQAMSAAPEDEKNEVLQRFRSRQRMVEDLSREADPVEMGNEQ